MMNKINNSNIAQNLREIINCSEKNLSRYKRITSEDSKVPIPNLNLETSKNLQQNKIDKSKSRFFIQKKFHRIIKAILKITFIHSLFKNFSEEYSQHQIIKELSFL